MPVVMWTYTTGMSIRLIVIDLDDTLLHGEEAAEASLAALRGLLPGVRWCVATGRPDGRLIALREVLVPTAGWIWSHGARGSFGPWGRMVLLNPARTVDLLEALVWELPEARIAVERGTTIFHDPGYPVVARPGGRRMVEVDRVQMLGSFGEMMRVHAPDGFARVRSLLVERELPFHAWDVGPDSYAEVTSTAATKVLAVQELARHLGVEPEEVAMIGDGHSDAAVLAWAGRGVAIAGGHRSALEAADVVADGFVEAVKLAVGSELCSFRGERETSCPVRLPWGAS